MNIKTAEYVKCTGVYILAYKLWEQSNVSLQQNWHFNTICIKVDIKYLPHDDPAMMQEMDCLHNCGHSLDTGSPAAHHSLCNKAAV